MSRYEKIQSGSAMHGVKYEVNLLMYCLLKSYQAKERFELSNGWEDKQKTDDIIVESDAFKIYMQVRHSENESKKITTKQLFDRSGKFSLMYCLEAVYNKIFTRILEENQKQLLTILKDTNTTEDATNVLETLLNTNSDQNRLNEDSAENIIWIPLNLKIEKIRELIRFFQNTTFCLITNIIPNDQVTKSNFLNSSRLKPFPTFDDFEEYYSFDTDTTTNELCKVADNSNIPKWFVRIFLQNFVLIKITDQALKKNILKLITIYSDRPQDNTNNKLFRFVEEWQSNPSSIPLSQIEIMNREFKQDLRRYENLLEFKVDSLLESLEKNSILGVKCSKFLLIMAILQKKLEDIGFEQTLFVNPFLDPDEQILAIQSFFHQKYTHLICVLRKNTAELTNILDDMNFRSKASKNLLKYKKIIVFFDEDVEMDQFTENEVITDDECFKEYKLRVVRAPTALNNVYINRQFIDDNNLAQSEIDFTDNIIRNTNCFIIISDSPGMGKTTVLSNLATKINAEYNFWAIIIQLNEFTGLLESNLESKTVPQLNEFLQVLVKSSVERQICEIPNMLILMVDGFDEISPDYKDIVTEFLKNTGTMKNVKTTLVTTRGHLKGHLEKQLDVKAFTLNKLTGDDVCSLICKFGNQNLDRVKEWYDTSDRADREFFKIPLHAKMFAEIFPQLNESSQYLKLNLYEIYDAFVNKKNEIFVKEKCKCLGNVFTKSSQNKKFRDLLHTSTQLSLQTVLPEETLKKFGINKSDENIPDEDLCFSGLFELCNNSLRFVHMSFQEFFQAKWIVTLIFNKNGYNSEIFHALQNIFSAFYYSTRFLEAYLEQYWNLINGEILKTFGGFLCNSHLMNLYVCDRPLIFRLSAEKCKNKQLLDDYFCHIINKYWYYQNFLCHEYHVHYVVSYLRKHSNTKERYFRALSVFHIAIYKGDLELARRILEEQFVSIHDKTYDGKCVLFLAITSRNIELIEYLISKGANIHEKTDKGRNLMHNTISSEESISLENLLRKEAHLTLTRPVDRAWIYRNPNFMYMKEKFGPLSTLDFVEYLISKGMDVNEKTNDGRSAFHCAVSKGDIELSKYLANEVVNIHEKTSDGRNVLHLAVSSENLELVKYLINRGVKLKEKTNEGENMLHIAALKGNLELVKYLVEKGVNVQEKTTDGRNMLHFAAYKGNKELAEYLIGKGVDIYEKTDNGRNMLHFALNGGNVEFVKYLISEGIITYDKRNNCEYLLNIALSRGNLFLVEYLIRNGQTLTRCK